MLDRMVEALADLLKGIGMNGTRLRGRWQNFRAARREAAARHEVNLRAVTGRHKMCPACRSLIPTGVAACPDCGAGVGHVAGPGPGRLLAQIFPTDTPVTGALLTVILAVFALMAATWGFSMPRSGGLGAIFGLLGFDGITLRRFGMGAGPWVLGLGEYWRLITPLFLHAGIVHLLFNCYVLLQIGRLLEEEFGGDRMWMVFLISGLCGGVASNFLRTLLTGRADPYVGASGAIFGLIGLAMIYGWRRGGAYGDNLRRGMITWTLYVLLFGFVVGADNFAHVGGLLGGAAMGFVVPAKTARVATTDPLWRLAAWLGVGVCLWAFIMMALHGADYLGPVVGRG
jgi:rhomboid protease GluP